jgi:putative DNA primase/helicase
MLSDLKSVVKEFDLPAFIAQHYPESGARPDRAASIRAVWRGDRKPSFSLYHDGHKWHFYDHATLERGDGYDFLKTVLGLPKCEVISFLLGEFKTLDVPPAKCKTLPPTSRNVEADIQLGQLIRHYDYRDLACDLVLQVLRYDPKDFRQRRPYRESHWVWGVTEGLYHHNTHGDWTHRGRGEAKYFAAAPKVVYHYPQLVRALKQRESLIIVDGEKDVETLCNFGIAATCVPKGMGSWQDEHSLLLKGVKDVTVVADNEPQGEVKARRVLESLSKQAGVSCVLTRVPLGKDISDYVQAGATRDDLEQLLHG